MKQDPYFASKTVHLDWSDFFKLISNFWYHLASSWQTNGLPFFSPDLHSSSVNLTLGSLNTRSVVNKAPLLHSLIADNDLSLLALTETWVKSDDPPVIKNAPAPPGYRIAHVHRENPDQTRGVALPLSTVTLSTFHLETTTLLTHLSSSS